LDCRAVEREMTDADILALGAVLQDDLAYLQSFSLAHLRLGTSALEYLSTALVSNSHLKTLRLPNCSIFEAEGVYFLAVALQQAASLQELDLSGNE
jgi:Ran GTPase-activating protein (RanGAP) involved in mRNA processing and transport